MREHYDLGRFVALTELLEASGWRIERGHIERPAWHALASCRGIGAAAFFVEDKGPGSPNAYKLAAEQYCAGCPVVEPCRTAGEHERHGLWGGQSPARRARRAA